MNRLPQFTCKPLEEQDKNSLIEIILLLQDQLDELTQRVQKLEDRVLKASRTSRNRYAVCCQDLQTPVYEFA